MKIQSEKRIAELDGFDNQSKHFEIKQNARAFEILSSNIYSDKILAVVREYGCNARDSHVAAGKPKVPFEVHLPNNFEPWFAIKDFGIGLSHDQVMKLYTTYFESTKGDSNEMVGALGLGSKSAFAYTDQFTVTSWYNGEKRVYSAYVDENGAPSITLLTEEVTTEGNGVEVQMSVKNSDFYEFADRAKKVFHRFETLPVVKGASCDLKQVKYVTVGTDFKIREQDGSYHSGHGCFAVQGSVAYPIEPEALGYDTSRYGNADYEMVAFLQNAPLDITFPIGELNITASRERLNYDKITRENIKKKIAEILEELPKQFEAEMAKAKTLWQAKAIYNRLTSIHSNNHIFNVVKKSLKWDNKVIDDGHMNFEFYDLVGTVDDKGQPIMTKNKDAAGNFIQAKHKEHYVDFVCYDNYSLRKDRPQTPKEIVNLNLRCVEDVSKSLTIVVVDKKTPHLNAFIRHNFPVSYGQSMNVVVVKVAAKKNLDGVKLLTDAGVPADAIKLISTLADLPKDAVKVKSRVKKVYNVHRFHTYGGIDIEEMSHDLNLGGYYFTVHHKNPVAPKDQDNPNDGQTSNKSIELFNKMQFLDLFKDRNGNPIVNSKLWAFNYHIRREVKNMPVWINVHDEVEHFWQSKFDSKAEVKQLKNMYLCSIIYKNQWLRNMMDYWFKYGKNEQEFKSNSKFVKIMKDLEERMSMAYNYLGSAVDRNKFDSYEVLNRASEYFVPAVKQAAEVYQIVNPVKDDEGLTELKTLTDQLMSAYPGLWKMFARSAISDNKDTFSKSEVRLFVQMCDASKSMIEKSRTPATVTTQP